MFNWLFYWKYFLLFLSINCCIRFKLPNNFPVFAENEEKKSSATYLRQCCLMIQLELNFSPSHHGSDQKPFLLSGPLMLPQLLCYHNGDNKTYGLYFFSQSLSLRKKSQQIVKKITKLTRTALTWKMRRIFRRNL